MKEKLRKIFDSNIFEKLMPIIALIIVAIIFGIATKGRFTKFVNLKLISNQACVIALIATGAVFVYSSGNMNTAMGGTTIIIALVSSFVFLSTKSLLLTILFSIISSIILIIIVVYMSKLLKVSMQTLTMLLMTFFSTLQNALLSSTTISIPYSDIASMQKNSTALILMAAFFIVSFVIFEYTPLGRELKYIGENKRCARLTGVKESKVLLVSYVLCSVGIGLAACAYLIRNASVSSTSGTSLNMDVILAMVLAGSPLKGGRSSKIYAGIVGAFLSVGLSNGLIMIGVSSYNVQIIKGFIFIVLLCVTLKRPKLLPTKQIL